MTAPCDMHICSAVAHSASRVQGHTIRQRDIAIHSCLTALQNCHDEVPLYGSYRQRLAVTRLHSSSNRFASKTPKTSHHKTRNNPDIFDTSPVRLPGPLSRTTGNYLINPSLTTRPQDPYTFRVSHSTIALTVGDFNRPFPDSGKDIKPAFSLFSHWFDFQIGIHSDAQYTVPSPRTGLRWDAQNTRVVIYPGEGKLTLTAILAVVMGVQAFMRSYEYMELSFVVKNVGGEKLAVGACYYLRPLGRPGVDDRAVKE